MKIFRFIKAGVVFMALSAFAVTAWATDTVKSGKTHGNSRRRTIVAKVGTDQVTLLSATDRTRCTIPWLMPES
jgi:hypothetical protein